jgi:integrase
MNSRTGCVRYRRGRWELDFRDALGRRHQEACGDLRKQETRQRKEAEARLHKRLEEVNAGKYQAPSEYITVEEMVRSYLSNHVAPGGVEPETLEEYERTGALHIYPHIGSLVARNVRRIQIETWRKELLAKEVHLTPQAKANRAKKGLPPRLLSPRTVSKAMELVSASFRYAMSHEWVVRDPTLGVSRPTKRNTGGELALSQKNVLSPEELHRYFAAAGDRWVLLLKFAAYTGMREAEMCGVSWDDVDFVTCIAHVRRTWRRGRFKVPKTAHSIREVHFPASLVPELKKWKLACPKGEHRLVFPTETGGPMNPANILHRGHYPALRRAGLRKVRFHDLRHAFATLALAEDARRLGGVSQQLGHADTAITLRVYRHAIPGEGKGIGDALAARVAAATPAPSDGGEMVVKEG